MTTTAVKASPILFMDEMVRANFADLKTQTRRPIDNKTALAWLAQGFTPEFVARRDNGLCRYGYAGDRLWGREAWSADMHVPGTGDLWYHDTPKSFRTWQGSTYLFYRADGVIVHGGRHDASPYAPTWHVPWRGRISDWKPRREEMEGFRWQPSILMPRWASRILNEITELRAQRVQDITEADAIAEGIRPFLMRTSMGDYNLYGVEQNQREHGRTARDGFAILWDSIHGDGAWERNDWVWAITYRRIH